MFFFFKQKTAYEMRISDWSSDVCSSDLSATGDPADSTPSCPLSRSFKAFIAVCSHGEWPGSPGTTGKFRPALPPGRSLRASRSVPNARLEEHTSELQSLMRISYAVFCLKKTTNSKHIQQHHTTRTKE